MKLEVLDINGKGLGREVELSSDVFGLELKENHEHVVYLAVKQYLAHQRQGTHKSKERAEIAGSTRKLHRQKGTGGARKGSIKNPLFRGGGRVFGPRPRNYGIKLNKKVGRLARKAALSNKAQDNRIVVIEDLKFDAAKTKNYIKFLEALNIANKKSLLLVDAPVAPAAPKAPRLQKGRGRKAAQQKEFNQAYVADLKSYEATVAEYEKTLEEQDKVYDEVFTNVALSARNLSQADVINARDLNVYETMNAECLVITESALAAITALLTK